MSKVPVTPQHVEENMPPPSYEEVMGHQALSSVKANLPKEQLPPLAYIDIMPRCLHPGDMRRKAPPEYDRFRYIFFCLIASCLLSYFHLTVFRMLYFSTYIMSIDEWIHNIFRRYMVKYTITKIA